MARFRKVDARMWNDAKVRELSERGKLVFLFAMTHPNLTMLGAMRATIPGLAAELPMDEEAFREAFRESLSKGMVKHDERASFLWLPNFLKYNKPESPNVVKAWPETFDLLPECTMKAQLFQHVKDFVRALSKGFQEAFKEAFAEDFAKIMPNQEQEQEQELEQEGDARAARSAPKPSRSADWNADPEESIPDGLSVIQYRQFVCERLRAADTNAKAFESAIRAVAHEEEESLAAATRLVIERGRANPPVDGNWWKWVSNGRWQQAQTVGVSTEGWE